MLLNGFKVAPLVDALGLHRATTQRALPARFRQPTQRGLGISHQDAQHAVQISIVEGETGTLQMIVVGKNLFGPSHIARCSLQFDGIGAQVDGDVQTVFQHV